MDQPMRPPAPDHVLADDAGLPPVPRVLTVAGSDSGGGAGLQADLKTVAAWGGYGLCVVTAVTAQNTQGVQSVHGMPVDVVRAQLESVAADIAVDAVKIGMLGSVPVMHAVADWLAAARPPRVVLDPVMVASSGDRLTDAAGDDARAAWARLVGLADLVTPNVPELEALAGRSVCAPPAEGGAADAPVAESAEATRRRAVGLARDLARTHGTAVLVKGGHLPVGRTETVLVDTLVRAHGEHAVTAPLVDTRATHGTGCTLSSALATVAATGASWEQALDTVRPWLTRALRRADRLGVGRSDLPTWHGPLDHGAPVR